MGPRTSIGTRVSLWVCTALFAAGAVFGHARLLGASPAAGAELTAPPASLTLRFNGNVRLARLKISAAGRAIPVIIDPDAKSSSSVTIALPPLAAGTYEVEWSALTPSDGHVVKGAYSFVIR